MAEFAAILAHVPSRIGRREAVVSRSPSKLRHEVNMGFPAQRSASFLGWLALSVLIGSARPAGAATITIDVAEFRWNVVECDASRPDDCLSLFSLTYLWTASPPPAPIPEPPVSGELSIDATSFGSFLELSPGSPFDQLFAGGVPSTAQASIGFFFGGARTLTSPLLDASMAGLFEPTGEPSANGLFHVFQFAFEETPSAVPEPATVTLLGVGLLAALRSRRRR